MNEHTQETTLLDSISFDPEAKKAYVEVEVPVASRKQGDRWAWGKSDVTYAEASVESAKRRLAQAIANLILITDVAEKNKEERTARVVLKAAEGTDLGRQVSEEEADEGVIAASGSA